MTEWRVLKQFPNYRINDLGQVFSRKSKRQLLGSLRSDSRTYVMLRQEGENFKCYIHDLMAEAFLPPCPGSEYWVDHIDGDKFNLSVDNLMWVKDGPSRFRAKNRKLMILETEEIFKNASECARYLEVSPTAVSKHLRGNLPTVKGMHIQYVS